MSCLWPFRESLRNKKILGNLPPASNLKHAHTYFQGDVVGVTLVKLITTINEIEMSRFWCSSRRARPVEALWSPFGCRCIMLIKYISRSKKFFFLITAEWNFMLISPRMNRNGNKIKVISWLFDFNFHIRLLSLSPSLISRGFLPEPAILT